MSIQETDFTTGSEVVTADGEKFGTLHDRAETYLLVRAKNDALTDIDKYVPIQLVDRVEDENIVLNASAADLEGMDLTVPPAIE
ncbi:MAG: DUF2171 domain-containing protein [Dehalococcoidia bacterium]